MPELFGGVLARGAVREAVSDAAWLRAMLDAEAALARARGLDELADAIGGATLDAGELGREAVASGNPVVPLVATLQARLGDDVHRGATSQDILDTATMLVA